ncbi:hypothetical protein BH23ACT9_BH23ACT9_26950 [soil metagenome]
MGGLAATMSRAVGFGLAVLLAAALLPMAPAVAQESEEAVTEVVRLWGQDRHETASAISSATFPDGADVVWSASGGTFADALAAGVAAAHTDAPLLLTGREVLPPSTAAELQRLAPDRLIVAGGEAAITDEVIAAATAAAGGAETVRHAGADRFATAAAIARSTFPDGAPVAYLATGGTFPDALAGGVAVLLRTPRRSRRRGCRTARSGTPGQQPREGRAAGPPRVEFDKAGDQADDVVVRALRDHVQVRGDHRCAVQHRCPSAEEYIRHAMSV